MTRKLVTVISLALVAVLSACEGDGFEPPRECMGPISLTVSSGTPPHFTWTAPCAVARVVVFEPPTLDATSLMWDVRSAPPRILSPVQYGVRPLGSTEEHAAEALVAGETYQVQVYSDVQIMIGSASFTP
ncbi:MAG: hypothetical protein M3125_07005 [Gemmatimonadota bacterium]|nr:hypothetical protein [Gemmatimonadota bacterium]